MANNAAFGNRILTSTRDKLLAKVVDTVLNSNVLATRLISKAKKWSGEAIRVPVKFQKNSTAQSFSGFDTFSTAATDNRVKMAFYPSFVQITSALPLDELSTNMNSDPSEKVLDLMRLTLESDAQDLADEVGTQFFTDGTGNGNKDILGLKAAVDDGTTVGTYGGLSRTTYTGLKSTVTASGGTISLDKMATLHDAVTSGSISPTIYVTTKAVFSLFEKLLQAQEKVDKSVQMMKDGLVMGTGATGIWYRGVQIVADEKCTTGYLYALNESFMDWYALPLAETMPIKYSNQIEGNDYNSNVTGLGFSFSDWIKPANAAALVGHIYLGGQLINRNPKRSGVLTGISGV